jgi:hypothetical protein
VFLMRDPPAEDESESCFRTAIDVAQTQEGKWWELRATVSLARLLRDNNSQRGSQDACRDLQLVHRGL